MNGFRVKEEGFHQTDFCFLKLEDHSTVNWWKDPDIDLPEVLPNFLETFEKKISAF